MKNFELIDDYLTDRLKGEERVEFERQLASNAALQKEVKLQQQILEGIKNARAAELKSMLNKVPVGYGVHFDFPLMRMAAGLIGAGVLAAAIYYYFRPEIQLEDASTDLLKKTEKLNPAPPSEKQKPRADSATQKEPTKNSSPLKEKVKVKPIKAEVIQPVVKPVIEVTNPSEELTEEDNVNDMPAALASARVTAAQVELEVDSSNKKYDFHYQFEGPRLMLYGSFDKSLFEVIEINGVEHSLFLFYKDQFYLLDEQQHSIRKLAPIMDKVLIAKLREYRK
ncbi:MAG: anti-sigma factor family protein [Bacteroidota bacterium]